MHRWPRARYALRACTLARPRGILFRDRRACDSLATISFNDSPPTPPARYWYSNPDDAPRTPLANAQLSTALSSISRTIRPIDHRLFLRGDLTDRRGKIGFQRSRPGCRTPAGGAVPATLGLRPTMAGKFAGKDDWYCGQRWRPLADIRIGAALLLPEVSTAGRWSRLYCPSSWHKLLREGSLWRPFVTVFDSRRGSRNRNRNRFHSSPRRIEAWPFGIFNLGKWNPPTTQIAQLVGPIYPINLKIPAKIPCQRSLTSWSFSSLPFSTRPNLPSGRIRGATGQAFAGSNPDSVGCHFLWPVTPGSARWGDLINVSRMPGNISDWNLFSGPSGRVN